MPHPTKITKVPAGLPSPFLSRYTGTTQVMYKPEYVNTVGGTSPTGTVFIYHGYDRDKDMYDAHYGLSKKIVF
jgi:hypothetical protein